WGEAEACYRAALTTFDGDVTPAIAQRLHHHDSGARSWLAWALESRGGFAEALALARTALRMAQVRGSKPLQAAHAFLLAIVWLGIGDVEEAVRVLELALEVCRAYDVRDWFGPVSMHLGYAYALTGRVGDGISLMEEGAAHAEAIKQMTNYPARLSKLAE